MAEQRFLSISKHRGKPPTLLTHPRITNGMYLAMKRLKPPCVQSQFDRFLSKSKREQLPPCDNPVLPSRQPS
ncbi:MAG TPA: hypothetical protein VGN84_11930 [Solirubrobacterales bacterium]|nr:hypothetical protein [Solirubrobacterales bacterium]